MWCRLVRCAGPKGVETSGRHATPATAVSEGDQQGNYVALLGNLLFPLIAFAGLFLLFRRAGDGSVSAAPRHAAPAAAPPSGHPSGPPHAPLGFCLGPLSRSQDNHPGRQCSGKAATPPPVAAPR